jgi:hypothetical protein
MNEATLKPDHCRAAVILKRILFAEAFLFGVDRSSSQTKIGGYDDVHLTGSAFAAQSQAPAVLLIMIAADARAAACR